MSGNQESTARGAATAGEQQSTVSGEPCLGVDAETAGKPLRDCVSKAIELYFEQLDDHEARNLHALVIAEVEAPLLAAVMEKAGGNQTRASQILGINRGTLRKKLRQYSLE